MPDARPILFSAPMIRALLDGRKTETRRVMKPQPVWDDGEIDIECPYGRPGDLLWVRERGWLAKSKLAFIPHVMNEELSEPASPDGTKYKAIPSIHMPRWASRLTLEITGTHAHRLQEISDEDAKAEGIENLGSGRTGQTLWRNYGAPQNPDLSARYSFQTLWQSINGQESWGANPWIWALTFKVHKYNVDALLAQKAA
jgi:hypothetical protein